MMQVTLFFITIYTHYITICILTQYIFYICILIHNICTLYTLYTTYIGGDAYARRVRRVRPGHERGRNGQPLRY